MPMIENRRLHFGIDNCHDLYDKLIFENDRLKDTQYKNKYDVFNFVITAYHLHDDWLSKDRPTRPTLACKKRDSAPKEMKLVTQAIKDLANGNKHMILDDRSLENKVVDVIHPPGRRDWYSYFYGPHIGISIGEYYYSCPILVDLIMSYFHWIFDDSIPVDEFPVKIKELFVGAVCIIKPA